MVYQTESKEVAELIVAELTELNPGWLFVVDRAGINYKTGQWAKTLAECPFVIKKFRPFKAGYKEVGLFTRAENAAHVQTMFKKFNGEAI
jgi:hypothetical protein